MVRSDESPGRAERGPLEWAGGLRPAQAGVALAGSARAAHIAATLIDLEIRGHLTVEQPGHEEDVDWLLTRRAGAVPGWGRRAARDRMLSYEKALLSGLPRRRTVRLSEAGGTKRWVTALRKTYRHLDREAIRRGWLRPSPAGEVNGGAEGRVNGRAMGGRDGGSQGDAVSMVSQVRSFRRYLTSLQPAEPDAAASLRPYLPYAVALGVTSGWAERFAALPSSAGRAAGSGYGQTDMMLGVAFADSACTHIHSAVTHGGHGGTGGTAYHDGGGHHGGGHHGGAFF